MVASAGLNCHPFNVFGWRSSALIGLVGVFYATAGCSLLLSFDDNNASDDGTSDASVDGPSSPDASCQDLGIELLSNGNFDDDNAGQPAVTPWVQSAGNNGDIIRVPPFAPMNVPSVPYTASFFFGVLRDMSLVQRVTIPAGATALQFRAQICFVSDVADAIHDRLNIELRVPGTTTNIATFANFTNQDGATVCSFNQFDVTVDGAFSGDADLALIASYPATLIAQSTFHFDTMSLHALTCP